MYAAFRLLRQIFKRFRQLAFTEYASSAIKLVVSRNGESHHFDNLALARRIEKGLLPLFNPFRPECISQSARLAFR